MRNRIIFFVYCLLSLFTFGQKEPQQKGESHGFIDFRIACVESFPYYGLLGKKNDGKFTLSDINYSYNYMILDKFSVGALGYQQLVVPKYNQIRLGLVAKCFFIDSSPTQYTSSLLHKIILQRIRIILRTESVMVVI